MGPADNFSHHKLDIVSKFSIILCILAPVQWCGGQNFLFRERQIAMSIAGVFLFSLYSSLISRPLPDFILHTYSRGAMHG